MNRSRRTVIKSLLAAVPVAAGAALGKEALAVPNGTRPRNLSVTSATSTQMKVSGRLKTLSGFGISGMRVVIYAVGEAYFTRWHTMYTNNTGDFSVTVAKTPVGTAVQIEVEGNGAYSRPFPTFNRP
jgi:hypothetical protein